MFTLAAQLIARMGLGGVFLLMLVENVVPVIPSELILPMAGFDAARGQMNPVLAALAGGAGSVVGGLAEYALGRWVGTRRVMALAARIGRWAAVTPEELARAERWFARHGRLAVLLGRCVPGVRGYICIPAGMTRMPFGRFLVASTVGSLAWSALLVAAGFSLRSHFQIVGRWLDPITDVLLGLVLIAYLARVASFGRATGPFHAPGDGG